MPGRKQMGLAIRQSNAVHCEIVLHLPLHRTEKEKPRYLFDSGVSFTDLVPER